MSTFAVTFYGVDTDTTTGETPEAAARAYFAPTGAGYARVSELPSGFCEPEAAAPGAWTVRVWFDGCPDGGCCSHYTDMELREVARA